MDRSFFAHDVRLDRSRNGAPHGVDRAGRAAAAFRGARGRPRRPRVESAAPGPRKGADGAGDREDLDERRARRLGGREGSRRRARPALRLGRLRGHSLLRHAERPGGLPAAASTCSACTTRRACSTWQIPYLGRRAEDGDERARRGERPARVLPAPDRVLRVRRARRRGARQPGRDGDHELAVGLVPRRGGPEERHQREDLQLAARVAEHRPARLEGDGRLHQLDARRHRGQQRRLRRGDPAHARGNGRRRIGREHLRRPRRRHLHAGPLDAGSCPGSRATRSSRSPRISATR